MLDLRQWLQQVEKQGELKLIRGANWDLEIGAISELLHRQSFNANKPSPLMLFDDIPGYPGGFRVLSGMLSSWKRLALTLSLPLDLKQAQLLKAWGEKLKTLTPVPARIVTDGAVLENVDEGDQVDLFKFPIPKWHELDGGRYLGTGDCVITRDPDTGIVNAGTYRVMVQDRNTINLFISPGKHGRVHLQKYAEKNLAAPVVITIGQSPLIFLGASKDAPAGISEFDWVGGIQGEPVPLLEGNMTGLPFPADAEIVVEGMLQPGETAMEGPFGEWTGYYASKARPAPVVHVNKVYYRNNPIICGASPAKPPSQDSFSSCFLRAAFIWEDLELAGLPDVRGVWCHQPGGNRMLTVVSIKQRYSGHARQAAMLAAQGRGGSYLGRYVIVVDEDIDIYDLNDVMWAVCTRSDPEKDIDILRNCWSGPLDPIIHPTQKGFSTKAIIDACRPYNWKDEFPPVASCSPELKGKIYEKWSALFGM